MPQERKAWRVAVNGVTFSTVKERGPICDALRRLGRSKPDFGQDSVVVQWLKTEIPLLKATEKRRYG